MITEILTQANQALSAVDESRHTVLVLTPNWTGSEWTDFEAILQHRTAIGNTDGLLPIEIMPFVILLEEYKRNNHIHDELHSRIERLENTLNELEPYSCKNILDFSRLPAKYSAATIEVVMTSASPIRRCGFS